MVKRHFWLIMLCFLLILVTLLSDSTALNNDSSLKLYLAFDEEKGKIAKDHSKSGLRCFLYWFVVVVTLAETSLVMFVLHFV